MKRLARDVLLMALATQRPLYTYHPLPDHRRFRNPSCPVLSPFFGKWLL